MCQETVKDTNQNTVLTLSIFKSDCCNKCLFCGHWALKKYPENINKNMIWKTNSVLDSNGKEYKLKDFSNCKDSGIYAAYCLLCQNAPTSRISIYVGKTSGKTTSFKDRWSKHRLNYNSDKLTNLNIETKYLDIAALRTHTLKYHPNESNLEIHKVYKVALVQNVKSIADIYKCEDKWKNTLKANINIQATLTSDFKG